MADSFVQVAPDSTGKKLDTSQVTQGGGDVVQRQRASIADDATVDAHARVLNAAPAGTDFGLVTRDLIADGADVNAGATTDAAVTTDVNATLSAKLRGLVKIFNTVWDSVNNLLHVNIRQYGGTATSLGQKPAAACLPVVLSSDTIHTVSLFPDITVNLDQVGAAAITMGQKTMAASVPVVIASDQTPLQRTLSFRIPQIDGTFVTVQVPATVAVDEFDNVVDTSENLVWQKRMLDEMRAVRLGIQVMCDYLNPNSGTPTQPLIPQVQISVSSSAGKLQEVDLIEQARSIGADDSEEG